MNKDVIYVEPENDITDIITKIENSPEKIVVLVPPKKAGVFRSVVNIKLIARAGASAEKTVVLVTVDPSIVKLAAGAKIPVTKDLKTPPSIPVIDEETEETEEEIFEHITPDEEDIEVVEKHVEKSEKTEEPAAEPETEEEPEEDEKEAKKTKKVKKTKNVGGFKGWLAAHKKPVIIGGVIGVVVIAFLVWAFGFAPAVTVGVEIQTETKSFAENVSFTTTASSEDAKNGVFYIQEKKVEQSQEIKFDATGKRNDGDKASGKITAYAYLRSGTPIQIPSGTTFTVQGVTFSTTEAASISMGNDDDDDDCENKGSISKQGCRKSVQISVAATAPGASGNLSWSDAPMGVQDVYTSGSTSGGTDKEVTIVEQIDVEKAKDQLKSSNESELKEKVMSEVGDNMMPIESSFKIETGNAEPNPAVGQEVGSGVTPTLKAVTTATIYAIDKAKLEEFITEKADVPDDQKVYQIEDAFIENFTGANGSFTGRLKGNYKVGPKVTDSEVAEMIKGKGLGEAQHDLKTINGVVNVTIDKSYPWVNSVPGDLNKITVNISVKGENNGNSGGENNS